MKFHLTILHHILIGHRFFKHGNSGAGSAGSQEENKRWVDDPVFDENFIVQMGAGGQARHAHVADHFTLTHSITRARRVTMASPNASGVS